MAPPVCSPGRLPVLTETLGAAVSGLCQAQEGPSRGQSWHLEVLVSSMPEQEEGVPTALVGTPRRVHLQPRRGGAQEPPVPMSVPAFHPDPLRPAKQPARGLSPGRGPSPPRVRPFRPWPTRLPLEAEPRVRWTQRLASPALAQAPLPASRPDLPLSPGPVRAFLAKVWALCFWEEPAG